MSTTPDELQRLVGRLHDAAGRLREGELDAAAAAALVDECAQTAAQASSELERLARTAASEPEPPPPAQGRLV